MAKSLAERIAEKKARIAKEDAELDALVAKAKTEDRKRDTSRKIVIGTAMLAAIEADPSHLPDLRTVLIKFVTRESDRSVVADLLCGVPTPAPSGTPGGPEAAKKAMA